MATDPIALVHDLVDDLARLDIARPSAGYAVIDALTDDEAAVLWSGWACEEAALVEATNVVGRALIARYFGPQREDTDGP